MEDETKLTDDEKCQLWLIDFEAAITRHRETGGFDLIWSPNEWGIKLQEFIAQLSQDRQSVSDMREQDKGL